MNGFVVQILSNTPAWVWAILATLVALGVTQLRERRVRRFTVLIAPVAFLIVGLLAAGRGPVGFAVWAVALLTAAAFTFLRPLHNPRIFKRIERVSVV